MRCKKAAFAKTLRKLGASTPEIENYAGDRQGDEPIGQCSGFLFRAAHSAHPRYRDAMSIVNSPWIEVSADLRNLQYRLSVYKSRFSEAGRQDIAEDLKSCIQLLIGAQIAATELHSRRRGDSQS